MLDSHSTAELILSPSSICVYANKHFGVLALIRSLLEIRYVTNGCQNAGE